MVRLEIQLTDLSSLTGYCNRQVILNYYQDEDFLWKRDGFHLASIQLTDELLLFLNSHGDKTLTVPLNKYERAIRDTQFPNFFVLFGGEERLEIYFP